MKIVNYFSASGQTCGQRRKMSLFNTRSDTGDGSLCHCGYVYTNHFYFTIFPTFCQQATEKGGSIERKIMCHPERSASGVELLRVERQRTSKSARHKPSRISYAIPEAFPTVSIYSYEQKISVTQCRSQIVAIRRFAFGRTCPSKSSTSLRMTPYDFFSVLHGFLAQKKDGAVQKNDP